MRLLLDHQAHRYLEDGVEIAASPDSRRPEPWLWNVGFSERPESERHLRAGLHMLTLPTSIGGQQLWVRYQSDDISAVLGTLDVHGEQTIERNGHEMVILVGLDGLLHEDRRVVGPGDALVVEGTDPLRIDVTSVGDTPAVVACIRLARHTGMDLRWIP